MKTFFCTLFLSLSFLSFVSAKSSAEVSGTIKDPKSEAVAFANVILYSAADSSMVKAEFSDDQGAFLISSLQAGSYWLQVSYVGFPDYKSEPFTLAEGEKKDMGVINMVMPENELEEVTVVAKRPILEVKPDKLVFNVDGSINATGNTGMELLRKSPGVIVDNNDNILLAGKSGVQIYINGKLSPLTGTDLAAFLTNLQSDEIDAIEIITNPSSRFDAQGNAGIINIRLKKDKKLGANGNVSLGYAQGITQQLYGSLSGNYRNKKLNAFGSIGGGDYNNENFMKMYREQPAGTFDQENVSRYNGLNQNFKLGTDFYLSDKHIVGFLAEGFRSDWDDTNNSVTTIAPERFGETDSVLVANGANQGINSNLNFNINYRFDNGKGTIWNMDADYGTFRNTRDELLENRYMDESNENLLQEIIFFTDSPKEIDIRTFKLDHERNLGETKLGAGFKLANVVTDNTFDFYNVIGGQNTLDEEQSNNFEYTENVSAAYLSLSRKVKKFGLSAGLRAEYTSSKGVLTSMQGNDDNAVDTTYLNLFPSAGITYQLNPKHSFQLNYSRRINRPNYQDLNPFVSRLDELVFEQGNPFLRPEYTNNFQLTHTFNYRFNTSISYSHTRDLITRITDIGEDAKSAYITWLNLAEQENVSLTFSAPLPITKWWSSFTNLTAYYVRNQADYGDGRVVDIDAKAMQVYGQHTFTLPKDFTLEVSGWWSSPSIWGGTFNTQDMWAVDAGVQKKVLNGKGNIKLSVTDIFKTQVWFADSLIGDLYQEGSGGWDSRRVRLNFTYRFGNENVKSRKRKTGLEDESSRVGSSN